MSEASILQIGERFVRDIPTACLNGQGQQHFDDFLRAIAVDSPPRSS